MKNRTPWPALAMSVGAPFQIQVLFPKILENSERLLNAFKTQIGSQTTAPGPRSASKSKVFLFKNLKFLMYLP